MSSTLVLASASPRRRELLQQIGISHRVHPVDIDESPLPNEHPVDMVVRLAKQKAEAAFGQLNNGSVVLAADTLIEFEGEPLGKPKDENDAIAMLLRLSNLTHRVHSAFCLKAAEKCHSEIVSSSIQFGEITEAQARAYWQTGEPADKAGSYAIQGLGAMFVKHLEGSYSGVVGLPLYECRLALTSFGVFV